jgi:hypothetical protein
MIKSENGLQKKVKKENKLDESNNETRSRLEYISNLII